jgi:hypothetical protein
MTKSRELTLDDRKAARARAEAVEDRRRQLIIDVAQYAQTYETMVTHMESRWSTASKRPDGLVHRDLLTARIRTGNHPLLLMAWQMLVRAEECIEDVWNLGNFEHDGTSTWINDDEFFMVGAHVAVEAVMFAATAEMGSEEDMAKFAGPAIALTSTAQQVFDDDDFDGRSASTRLRAALDVARELSSSRQQRARSSAQVTEMISERVGQLGSTSP